MDDIRPAIPTGSNRFIHQVRKDLWNKGYSYQTEKTYIHVLNRGAMGVVSPLDG